MLTKGINFKNFTVKTNYKNLSKNLNSIIKKNNEVLNSLGKNYIYSYDKKKIKKFKKNSNFRIIGMGGSSLGAQAIYDFLKHKIKKNFEFINNLQSYYKFNNKKNFTNLIISKSGNTIETIVNSNILIKRKDKNIFITEEKDNYLYSLAQKLKGEIIHHNNFIGGRYSVLSEVGMLPVELMGLKPKDFKVYNNLIKNKLFMKSLISNVDSILYFSKKKKI